MQPACAVRSQGRVTLRADEEDAQGGVWDTGHVLISVLVTQVCLANKNLSFVHFLCIIRFSKILKTHQDPTPHMTPYSPDLG